MGGRGKGNTACHMRYSVAKFHSSPLTRIYKTAVPATPPQQYVRRNSPGVSKSHTIYCSFLFCFAFFATFRLHLFVGLAQTFTAH